MNSTHLDVHELDLVNSSHRTHEHGHDEDHERSVTEMTLEIIFLLVVSTSGTFGNLLVIFAISLKKKIHKNGNMFLINLAVADLYISSVCVPSVIANIIKGESILSPTACTVLGYVATMSWTCSMSNLAFVAANRYWAVVHHQSYSRIFSKKRMMIMVACTWIWANLLLLPVMAGWSKIGYDHRMMACLWHDEEIHAFNSCLLVAIFLPVLIILFCYWRLYRCIKTRGKWAREQQSHHCTTCNERPPHKRRPSIAKEIVLMRTLAATVCVFLLFLLPYGLMLMIHPEHVAGVAEKVVAWIALSNSSVNFIIYGATNPGYRGAYVKLLKQMFFCRRRTKSPEDESPSVTNNYSKQAKKNRAGAQTPPAHYPDFVNSALPSVST